MQQRPRVLIATDEPNFSLGLVEGYRSLGWEVVTGAANFRIEAAGFDVIHYQWPEEFSRWGRPTDRELKRIDEHLQSWAKRAINIFTVNNLYPHQLEGDAACHQLYSSFYRHCQLVSHYAPASKRLVLEEFPAARNARHVIHTPPSYEVTLARQLDRGSRREELGIRKDEFVVLMFGALRSWDEMRLLRQGYSLAEIPNKRMLMAGKFRLKGSGWARRWQHWHWRWWLFRQRAIVDTSFVPEDEISRFLDSCDVAVVPRLGGLSSGIPFVAMTFGRMVIAPDHGIYPDVFAGTQNLLYKSGSAESLARALEKSAAMDLNGIGRENAGIAATWTWKHMVRTCLEAAATLEVPAAAPLRAWRAERPKDE
jgi:hypothetical protein